MSAENETRRAAHVEPETKAQVLARLKRIEGQIRGLQRMVEEEQYCGDVLVQVASVHEALRGAGKLLMHNHLRHCITGALQSGDERDRDAAYGEVLDLMYKHVR